MPIGKDSITKRVAKTNETKEKKIAPELVATTAAAPKKETAPKIPEKKSACSAKSTSATAKKTASTTTKKTASTTAKKPAAKATPSEAKKSVDTAVLANVSPETVAAVIGHKEDEKYDKIKIGQKLPEYLL